MQRRSGRSPAHISLSHTGELDSDGYILSEKPPSRLNQRTLGLTNRIWIILSLFAFVVFFTRAIFPAEQAPPPRQTYFNSHLRSKNYLNSSAEEPSPFDFCPVFGPGDEIGAKYGVHALTKSRLHLGSGARVQRVVHKALSGLPVTISVLGGSVSACHGAGDDPISPKCYPSRFFQWWNSYFPNPASELTNGAMRRTNSAYFSFCNSHHLPDITDLIILDFDVDDPNNKEWLDHFELLVRSLLVRQDQPAVIIFGHFSPQVQQAHGFHGPDALHSVVAQYYDVPHISIKPYLYPQWIADPTSILSYYVDPILANPSGHELMADFLIAYFQSQICAAWSAATGHTYDVVSPLFTGSDSSPDSPGWGPLGGVGLRPDQWNDEDPDSTGGKAAAGSTFNPLRLPDARIGSRPTDDREFEEVQPFCVSANDLINPLPPSLFYGSGWHAQHPPIGVSQVSSYSHYWYSTLPSSKLRVPIKVGSGEIGVYYLREPLAAVEQIGSTVECWVDNNYAGAKALNNAADVGESTPTLEMIDHFVARGSHYVECQLMGDEGRGVPAFKILGIFTT